jgi:hypothetical protein
LNCGVILDFITTQPSTIKNVQLKLKQFARVKRQGGVDPKAHLDQEIDYLISTLPTSIDLARDKIEASQRFKVRIGNFWSRSLAENIILVSSFCSHDSYKRLKFRIFGLEELFESKPSKTSSSLLP